MKGLYFLGLCLVSVYSSVASACKPEPDIAIAKTWWPPLRDVWTPLGWPSHLFRFQMVYNGTLLCTPAGWMDKPDILKYKDKNFQLSFYPSLDGTFPPLPNEPTKVYKMDGGIGIQGWRSDKETPVLWTKWPRQDGVVMKSEVFAHMKGGRDVVTGVEPLYAWIRLSVAHVDPIRAPLKYTFAVQLSQDYYDLGSTLEDSLFLLANPPKARLTEALTSQPVRQNGVEKSGLQIEQNGNVRLRVLPGGDGTISFAQTTTNSGIYDLKIELPVREGAHADILVPMLPESSTMLTPEAELGFDGALAQCETFWSKKPATAAHIHTPENYINDAIARNIQFARIISERNPETGEYSFLTGSYGYDALWSTPTSMISFMFLDLLGYHNIVEKNVQIFKATQGTVRPPGSGYALNPGYFSTPKSLTAINWLSDNGAILEMICQHALLTGDRKFIGEWVGPILKSCGFIKDACAATNFVGIKGVMPPAVATDSSVESQAVWSQAWNYKGLVAAVKLLNLIGDPHATEFAKVAADFKSKFQAAFLARIEKEPKWTAPDGERYSIPPLNLLPPPVHHVYDEAFRLDTGPLCLPWSGLLDANDSTMHSFADFFRVGPNNELRGPQTGAISRAVLIHEISSCEPCYSWNIVNSWKTGDRNHFLEGMYSLFAGAISTQTYINCEHRNGMYGNVFIAPLMTWCLRQAVIDDQLADGELHLLRLCPLAWISKNEETVFENMPTIYGPVNLRFKKSADDKTLDVSFNGQWRKKPKMIVFHKPPVPGLSIIIINEKHFAAKDTIDLKEY